MPTFRARMPRLPPVAGSRPALVGLTAAVVSRGSSDLGATTRVVVGFVPPCSPHRCHLGHPVGAANLGPTLLELDTAVAAIDEILVPSSRPPPPSSSPKSASAPTAGAFLVAPSENSERLHNEPAFARLCGAAPHDASSGKHRSIELRASPERPSSCSRDSSRKAVSVP